MMFFWDFGDWGGRHNPKDYEESYLEREARIRFQKEEERIRNEAMEEYRKICRREEELKMKHLQEFADRD